VEDGVRHSRVNLIPFGNTTDPHERFVVQLKFFRGSEQPVHTFLSEPFGGDHNFRYEGRDLLAAIRAASFEGIVEITARSLEQPPAAFPWVDSWMEFYADDESINGSVPGFVFKGGVTKTVMSGKWQHWPGVVIDDHYSTSLLLLNYHPRAMDFRVDLFAPSGRMAQSATLSIPTRMPLTVPLEEQVPGARALLAGEGGIGSMRVWSQYKLPGFVFMRNRHSGVVTSFDHTVPFAGAPVD
jgi:hypothetical protein